MPKLTSARPRALAAAFLLACVGAASGGAQTLEPRHLAPSMAAWLEHKIEERGALIGCAAANPRLRDMIGPAWADMRRSFVTLLWAGDFPVAHVQAMGNRADPAKLDAGPAPAAANCADPALAKRIGEFGPSTWNDEVRALFKRLGFASDVTPLTDEQRRRIRDLVAKEGRAQGRMLNCVSVIDPAFLGIMMQDWAKQTAASRLLLQSVGYPRDELASLFDPIEPNALYAITRNRAELRDACLKEKEWETRWGTFAYGAFAGDVQGIVTGKR